MMQMLALGHVTSLEEGRELVRRSFGTRTYMPRDVAIWDEAYKKYLTLFGTY
jgi:hypothetical protein